MEDIQLLQELQKTDRQWEFLENIHRHLQESQHPGILRWDLIH